MAAGAQLDLRDDFGDTALSWAAQEYKHNDDSVGHGAVVEALVAAGAQQEKDDL